MSNNNSCSVIGIGSVSLKLEDGGKEGYCEVLKKSKPIFRGIKINGVYVVQGVQKVHSALVVTSKEPTEGELWHKRLSHISAKVIQALNNQGILPKGIHRILSFCKHCVIGKATRQSFVKAQHTTKVILDYVHSDL
ncbi:uncharacterized mitochondrial protein AtMg00300-like [Benincasa hispida]|uniref:uncharacterized mitochondrial protein AtMg00300-like n=1 Tax=Benincasa hispida TaxID=102211 RepID=UPI0019005249|nr:uncharacterized mitochondrial protein AtMg00300-like [Benincasa hispida]